MLTRILPYSAAVILSVLYFRVAQIMVSLLSSGVQTGYFGVSFRVLESITMIPPLLVSSALPILARTADTDSVRFAYAGRRLAETMLIVGVGFALILFLGAEVAVDIVAGPGFEPAVDVVRVLAVALIGTFIIAARGYALLSLDLTRMILVANAIALGVVVLAGIPLIRAHGAIGGGIALVAGELALAACYELALNRHIRGVGIPIGSVVRVALAAALATVPLMLLGPPALVMAIAGALIYVVALYAIGGIPPELYQDLLPGRASAGKASE